MPDSMSSVSAMIQASDVFGTDPRLLVQASGSEDMMPFSSQSASSEEPEAVVESEPEAVDKSELDAGVHDISNDLASLGHSDELPVQPSSTATISETSQSSGAIKLKRGAKTCPSCSKVFARSDHLKRHFDTIHTGKDLVSCEDCGRQMRGDSLKNHKCRQQKGSKKALDVPGSFNPFRTDDTPSILPGSDGAAVHGRSSKPLQVIFERVERQYTETPRDVIGDAGSAARDDDLPKPKGPIRFRFVHWWGP